MPKWRTGGAIVGKNDENIEVMLTISRSIEKTLREWKEQLERDEKGAKD